MIDFILVTTQRNGLQMDFILRNNLLKTVTIDFNFEGTQGIDIFGPAKQKAVGIVFQVCFVVAVVCERNRCYIDLWLTDESCCTPSTVQGGLSVVTQVGLFSGADRSRPRFVDCLS